MRNKRVLVLLIVLVIIALGSAYFFLFLKNVNTQIQNCESQITQVNSEIETANSKIAEMKMMEKELAEIKSSAVPMAPLPEYNNLNKVLLELNTIMAGTNNYSIQFSDAVGSDNIARRTIEISFSVPSYIEALNKISAVNNSQNRYLITDIAIQQGANNEIVLGSYNGDVAVSMALTCFEYITPDGEKPVATEEDEVIDTTEND